MFFEHEREGSPIMRPMLSEYPMDKAGFKLDDQYMLSDKLLVRPVIEKGVNEVNVHFPSIDGANEGELWYDCDDYTVIDFVGVKSIKVDDDKIPVYQRGGSIIPKKETIRSASAFMQNDPYTLIVALDKNQHAHGTLYIDDEKSFEYRRGKYIYINFEFHDGKLSNHFINSNYTTQSKVEKIIVAGLDYIPTKAQFESFDGKTTDLKVEDATETSFVIVTSDVTLMNEWTITVSGALQNVICGSLLMSVMIVHFSKYLIN